MFPSNLVRASTFIMIIKLHRRSGRLREVKWISSSPIISRWWGLLDASTLALTLPHGIAHTCGLSGFIPARTARAEAVTAQGLQRSFRDLERTVLWLWYTLKLFVNRECNSQPFSCKIKDRSVVKWVMEQTFNFSKTWYFQKVYFRHFTAPVI